MISPHRAATVVGQFIPVRSVAGFEKFLKTPSISLTMTKSPPSKNESPAFDARRWSVLGSALGPFLALGIVVGFFGVADGLQADGGNFLSLSEHARYFRPNRDGRRCRIGDDDHRDRRRHRPLRGTSLALCATVLAWCLKEDAAMLIVHGDNVAGCATKNRRCPGTFGTHSSRNPARTATQKRRSGQNRPTRGRACALQKKLPELEQTSEDDAGGIAEHLAVFSGDCRHCGDRHRMSGGFA